MIQVDFSMYVYNVGCFIILLAYIWHSQKRHEYYVKKDAAKTC